MIKLNWRPFVEMVRDLGIIEHPGSDELRAFMYCDRTNVFVTDRELLEDIQKARQHLVRNEPVMFIGPKKTGKSIFLNLIWRGDPDNPDAVSLKGDDWRNPPVGDSLEDSLERFFGLQGEVITYPEGMIHFDYLERARGWHPFIERMLMLVTRRRLITTTGPEIPVPNLRIVGGAAAELSELLYEEGTDPLFVDLYAELTQYQLARTRLLTSQMNRLEDLLVERIATEVIKSNDDKPAEKLEDLVPEFMEKLVRYEWPAQFNDLDFLVHNAFDECNWDRGFDLLLARNVGKIEPVAPVSRSSTGGRDDDDRDGKVKEKQYFVSRLEAGKNPVSSKLSEKHARKLVREKHFNVIIIEADGFKIEEFGGKENIIAVFNGKSYDTFKVLKAPKLLRGWICLGIEYVRKGWIKHVDIKNMFNPSMKAATARRTKERFSGEYPYLAQQMLGPGESLKYPINSETWSFIWIQENESKTDLKYGLPQQPSGASAPS